MKLYRILTEDVNRADIERLVSVAFDGFTIVPTIGYWKGAKEASLVVEIYATDADLELVRSTAQAIKLANKQEAVMVQILDASGEVV